MVPQKVRCSLETYPSRQEVQVSAPSSSETELPEHSVQLVTESSRYVPAEHSTEEFIASQSAKSQ